MVVALVVVAVAALAVGAFLYARKQREKVEATYQRICRDHQLTPTDRPLGLSDDRLAQFELLPRGDRDRSAVWGVTATASLDVADRHLEVPCCSFEWWWEDERTTTDSDGHTSRSWVRTSVLATLVELPEPFLLPRVRLEEEGLFTKLGLGGRGDFQVESEQFNARFDVRTRDPDTAIRLFDAGFQQAMLSTFHDVAFELAGDVALVVVDTPRGIAFAGGARRGGTEGLLGLFDRSGDRIRTDPEIIEALPTARLRALALLRAMPDAWWRAVRGPA